jgi:hypothetical protein
MPESGNKKSLEDQLRGLSGSLAGVKLGPGLIGNLSIVGCAAFLAICGAAWSLRGSPEVAATVVAIIVGLTIYIVERLVRFAEKNPAAALLGSSELYRHMKDEMGAKDPKVIRDRKLADGTPVTIQHQARRDE